MLYLRTGLPGASKTLNTLKEICEDKATKGRDIFYNNIKLLLLDLNVVQSFQGFFYGYVLPSFDKKDREKYNKILLRVHGQGELISETDVPHLRVHFEQWLESGGAVNLFVDWCRRVYPSSKLVELEDYLKVVDTPGVDDIRQFKLDWKDFPDPTQWPHLPPHSIIVVDECQRWFPPRPVGAKVPNHVSQFETHRHKGLDIHLVTQDAKLLDSHVRRLVGRHIHFHNPLASKRISRMENDKAFDPADFHQRKNATKSVKKRDSSFYGLYWSADVHTHKRRFPKILLLLIPTIGFPIYTAYFLATMGEPDSNAEVLNNARTPQQKTVNVSSTTAEQSSESTTQAIKHFDALVSSSSPLAGFCDRVTYAGNEIIQSDGKVEQRFYLQCIRNVKSESDSDSDNGDDDSQATASRGYLLDSQFLAALGYELSVLRGMPVLKYENQVFVFPKL
ncbi:zonular occludens toxin Zot [Idiomarina aquatica]|uniref:Zonular occludens toxin Zot n=1 Tax=Idiomarina aquatica TaxID=1327752 RepID=A0A4R6PRW5_9GAMM|nr:zonular occludens toxin domain-containing protein [Idiomarina aquatica]TDP40694.1 zonular occludens toxin Zot [Idiomarina aquatica]